MSKLALGFGFQSETATGMGFEDTTSSQVEPG